MKILVIGASRGVGLELVKQGLDRDHEVTALLRKPDQFERAHARLCKKRGDAAVADDVRSAAQGQDAIVTCVGLSPTRERVELFSRTAANVLAAIDGAATRYIAVTGIGSGESRGHGGFFYDRLVQPLLLRSIYDDKDREEALIKASAVDWLILRPGWLTNGPRTGVYRAVTELRGFTAGKISRADVADFILNQIERPSLFKQAPVLTY